MVLQEIVNFFQMFRDITLFIQLHYKFFIIQIYIHLYPCFLKSRLHRWLYLSISINALLTLHFLDIWGNSLHLLTETLDLFPCFCSFFHRSLLFLFQLLCILLIYYSFWLFFKSISYRSSWLSWSQNILAITLFFLLL